MVEHPDSFLYKLRFVFAALLVIASLVLLSVLVSGISSADSLGPQPEPEPTSEESALPFSDSDNAVTNAFLATSRTFGRVGGAAARSMVHAADTVTGAASHVGTSVTDVGSVVSGTGRFIGSTAQKSIASVTRGTGNGALLVARGIGGGLALMVHIPVSTLGFVAEKTPVSAVIQPADHSPVPVIDPHSPALLAAQKALPATPAISTSAAVASTPILPADVPAWPLHGTITTPFGVPEYPYEAIHTGLDISDGRPAGVSQIKAYRRGTVIDTIYGGGLGNHVIVDHGSGVTSVYGHMSSITVKVGQQVDTSTTLGYEGSTGLSTGPHLHFEIRVNGQATDPHKFISGQPY
jgi:hypothetical protein